jgi:uncharacterized protein YndB with AHSA1/START domain
MSNRSANHATFVIERVYDAEPPRVFAAWADQAAKSQWFGTGSEEHALDFRVGGREHLIMRTPEGVTYAFDSTYQDIVPDERIVYSYDMHRDEARISVSVATVEMISAEGGTLLRLTEQGVFLDGHDDPAAREHGTGEMLDALAGALRLETSSR